VSALDRHNFHDFILQVRKEEIDDLELLDRERKEVDLLHRLNLAILHETTKLGDRTLVAIAHIRTR